MSALRRFVLAVFIVLALSAVPCGALDTIYIVRHAEKDTAWPDALDAYRPLSRAGEERAERLAGLLENAGIEAIYSTPTTRTLATGMPLAHKRGIAISASRESGDAARQEGFLSELRKSHAGHGAVLVVGHSDTVPQLLIHLGAEPACYDRVGIAKDPEGLRVEGYDGLWRVDLRREGCARITRRGQDDGAKR